MRGSSSRSGRDIGVGVGCRCRCCRRCGGHHAVGCFFLSSSSVVSSVISFVVGRCCSIDVGVRVV